MCQVALSVTGGQAKTLALGLTKHKVLLSFPSYYFKVGDTSSAWMKCSINSNFFSTLTI